MKHIKFNSIFKSFIVVTTFIVNTDLYATSFDCTKATQKSEKMVCDSPVLSSLDDKMFSLYQKAKNESANPESLKQAQIGWIKQTRTCGDESCMVNLYNQRINELSPVNTTIPSLTQSVKVEDNKQTNSANNNQSEVKNTQDTKPPEVPSSPVEPSSVATEPQTQEVQTSTNQTTEIKNNNTQSQNSSDEDFGIVAYILGALLTLLIILLPAILKKSSKK
jgi:uncharacterized protein